MKMRDFLLALSATALVVGVICLLRSGHTPSRDADLAPLLLGTQMVNGDFAPLQMDAQARIRAHCMSTEEREQLIKAGGFLFYCACEEE